MVTFDNITLYNPDATLQDAYEEWVRGKKGELRALGGDDVSREEEVGFLWAEIRRVRDRLLTDTDWLFHTDSPPNGSLKGKMRVYRLALRDIPQQFLEPEDVVFPLPPGEDT